jgi:hypothetical protein
MQHIPESNRPGTIDVDEKSQIMGNDMEQRTNKSTPVAKQPSMIMPEVEEEEKMKIFQIDDIYQMQMYLIIKGQVPKKRIILTRFLLLLGILIKQYCLIIIYSDLYADSQFYDTNVGNYIGLRYFLIIFTFFIFQKALTSINQSIQILSFWRERFPLLEYIYLWFIHIVVRALSILMNELICVAIILTTNLGREQGLGLILNFSAAVIIVEFDTFVAQIYFF